MNIIIWIAQVILAAGFIWAATMKLFQPTDELAKMWPWTADHAGLVKFTGILDLLTGIGLILPTLLRIQPRLTIYAAYGTVVLMITASIFHIARAEASLIGVNIFFAVIALFIAWGRQKKAPVATNQSDS
ncbi:DoxX family protein [Pseudarcicella hirudinis]|nr:DoxX family protein [Pseudarcicella hirudinis]